MNLIEMELNLMNSETELMKSKLDFVNLLQN